MTEIPETSEGMVVAEETDSGIYNPYCLVRDEEVCIPSVGGEWTPCVFKLTSI